MQQVHTGKYVSWDARWGQLGAQSMNGEEGLRSQTGGDGVGSWVEEDIARIAGWRISCVVRHRPLKPLFATKWHWMPGRLDIAALQPACCLWSLTLAPTPHKARLSRAQKKRLTSGFVSISPTHFLYTTIQSAGSNRREVLKVFDWSALRLIRCKCSALLHSQTGWLTPLDREICSDQPLTHCPQRGKYLGKWGNKPKVGVRPGPWLPPGPQFTVWNWYFARSKSPPAWNKSFSRSNALLST